MEIYGLITRALRRVSQARGRAALRPKALLPRRDRVKST